ncbi:MAG: TolC family protein [Candidatus Aminicenantes bacterium]
MKIKRMILAGTGILLICTNAFLPPRIHAQKPEIQSFSLRDAQEFAALHSYDSLKSLLDVEAAKKKLKETLADGLPQISSSLGYQNNLELPTVLIPDFIGGDPEKRIAVQFGTQHNANFSISVDQKIFDVSYFVGLNTSKIYRQLAEQGLERTQLDVKETVTNTYFLILVSKETERIIRANIKNLEKTLYEISESYKEGFVEETDVDVIQISVTALKNSLQNVQKQTDVAFKLLKFQMGLDLYKNIEVTENLEEILRQIDIQEAVSSEFELSQNIDYKLLNTQEKLAEMAHKNAKAKFWPTISAFYTYQQAAQRNSFDFLNFNKDWFRSQIFGVNVYIPIFKSGGERARVAQAAIALEQARTARIQASQGILLEDAEARNALSAAHENYLNVKDNMELSEKVYNATLIKYREGIASSTDLTQANDRYLLSQSNYIQAISTLLNAKNKLDRIRNTYD